MRPGPKKLGYDAYLTKPINPEELKAKLVKWLPADGKEIKLVQKDGE
jgi:DNA-binding response OmpR family regulator